MHTFFPRLKDLVVVCAVASCAGATAQVSTPPANKPLPLESVRAAFEATFAGTPVRGAHKRYHRLLHEQELHLDDRGRVFNYTRANWDAAREWRLIGYPAQLQGDWKALGPFGDKNEDYLEPDGYQGTGGIGRVNGLYFESASVWYAISAGGGLWRTTSAGLPAVPGTYPWEAVNDDMPVMALSDLAGIPGRSDTLWLLTGDGFGQGIAADGLNLVKPGVGILMSPDSGRTWQTTSVNWDQPDRNAGFKLLTVPGDPYTQMAATTNGLYRTTDGWQTSSRPLTGGMFCDLEFEPGNPAVVYAGAFGSLWKSTDTGATWTDISANTVTTSPWSRTGIALSPDDPNRLYLLIVDNGGNLGSIQVSNDAGNSFSVVTPAGFNLLGRPLDGSGTDGQGNYDLALWVDPDNADRVFVGGINLWESTDGANNWTLRAEWTNDPPAYVHADIHNIQQAPDGTLLVCSDGGVYGSANGIDWAKRYDGMAITQFYHGYGAKARPDKDISEFGGGAQDNGSLVNELPGPDDNIYTKVSGGDGFSAYRGTPRGESTRYTSSQFGTIYRQEDDAVTGWGTETVTPSQIANPPDGAWDTPFEPSTRDFNEMTAGYRWLYYTTDADDPANWTEVPFDRPGGSYHPNGRVLEIDWSFSDANTLYFAFNEGGGGTQADLWVCRNWADGAPSGDIANCACSTVAFDSIFPYSGSGRAISDISSYDTRPEDIVVTRPGYLEGSKVYRCRNTDSVSDPDAWENISYNLPNLPMLCALNDYTGVYVGTDIGAFFLPDGDTVWVYFAQGLPTVPVTELWRHDRPFFGQRLFAATYGRGLWTSPFGTPRRQTRWYVDDDATGTGTGADWANAFNDLQEALDAALAFDTIWVAEGTYAPTGENGLAAGIGDDPARMRSFRSGQPGVQVYGGFIGNEDSLGQRPGDPLAHPTVLSGDLGVAGDSTDNAYHVFVFTGANRGLALDGFHVRGGQADGSILGQRHGGGIYCANGPNATGPVGFPRFSRLLLEGNYAEERGGGLYVEAESDVDDILELDSLSFVRNRCGGRGGGLALNADSLYYSLSAGRLALALRHAEFLANTANLGAGLHVQADGGARVTGRIDHWSSAGNRALNGGGLCIEAYDGGLVALDLFDARFDADSASGTGGGLCVLDNFDGRTPLNLYRTVFEGCGANEGGGLGWSATNPAMGPLRVDSNSAFLDNRAVIDGGGLLLDGALGGNTLATFRATRLIGNRAGNHGGAVASLGNAVRVDLTDVRMVGNTAGSQGGAWYASFNGDSALLDFRNVVCRENLAGRGGAGLLNANAGSPGILSWRGGTVSANTASQSGGAIVSLGSATAPNRVSLTDCRIDSNTALSGVGGALEASLTQIDLEATPVRRNTASGNGGSIFLSNGFHNGLLGMALGQADFIGNRSGGGGGAIHLNSDGPVELDVAVDSVTFSGNRAAGFSDGGGAVSLRGTSAGRVRFARSAFLDDSARSGGALYVLWTGPDSVDLSVEDVTFDGNEASASGGAVWMRHPEGTHRWTAARFTGNRAGATFGGGGALYAYPYSSTGGRWTLDRCWFSGNEAPNANGGAIHVEQFGVGDTLDFTLRNTVLAGNSARGGAGQYVTAFAGNHVRLTWDFVTAYGNTAGTSGGGALNLAFGGGAASLRNSLLWANTAAFGEDQAALSGGYTGLIDGSLWSGTLPAALVPGPGNASGVALFADSLDWIGPDAVIATADDGLRPAPGGAQLDAADSASAVAEDLRGAPRPTGAAPDAGAYEGDPTACVSGSAPDNLASSITLSPAPGVTLTWDPIPLSVACNVQGRPLGAPSFANLFVFGSAPAGTTVPGNVLVPGLSYEWKVRCACSTGPLDATPFSVTDTFTVPTAREAEGPAMALFPNPAGRQALWTVNAPSAAGRVTWRLIDATGATRRSGRTAWTGGAHTTVLDLDGLTPGAYRLVWRAGADGGDLPLVVAR